ncbi:MAG TPA: fumarylacetoacetate hydrolase family protein, partial [Paracoccaceae bacterium]|nr:fumarylacetoacetate hydrolase family protein [Paracoccaceae bacterium]
MPAAARQNTASARSRFSSPSPIPKILCVGVNYLERNAEYRDGSEAPTYPSLFCRFPSSFAPHGESLWLPPESAQLDYEGEIVLVIGRPGRRIPKGRFHEHIAGLTIMNEGAIRDWVRHGKFNVTQGKNWARSGGLGPW